MDIRFGNPNIEVSPRTATDIFKILDSGWVSIGKHVDALERHFEALCGVKYAIACSSATTGLIIAVKAAGWKNTRVHLPAFTWPSTLYAIQCNNNIGHFCDIEQDSWLMQKDSLLHFSDDCVMPVDIFGNQASVYESFPRENRIYDAAHSYGLPMLGKRGIAEVVSLSFTKVVTAMEGGVILTDDDKLADVAIELRRLTGRMGEINALIAMKSIENYNPDQTSKVVNYYKKHITVSHGYQYELTATNNSVFSLVFAESSVRNAIMTALAKAGVETKVYYDPLVRGFKNTEEIYSKILSLPTHEGVIPVQDDIIEIINLAGRGGKTPGKDFVTQ